MSRGRRLDEVPEGMRPLAKVRSFEWEFADSEAELLADGAVFKVEAVFRVDHLLEHADGKVLWVLEPLELGTAHD